MSIRNADTRDVVESSIELAKRTHGHEWRRIDLGRNRKWTSLTLDAGLMDQFEEELQDAIDARVSREEVKARGAKPLAIVRKELGL